MALTRLLSSKYRVIWCFILCITTAGCDSASSAVQHNQIATSRPHIAPNIAATSTPVILPTLESSSSVQPSTPTTAPAMPNATSPPVAKTVPPTLPSPTAIPSPMFTATSPPVLEKEAPPKLLQPEDKSVFNQNIKFKMEWTWHRVLNSNEWFDVMVWNKLYEQPHGIAWTNSMHYEISAEIFPMGEYNWTVRVLRDAGVNEEGEPQWIEVTPMSEIFSFEIRN